MTNYVKATNFASKDALPPGDAQKKVKGAEINTEFDAIATAIESKANKNSPALEGTPTAPTASAATNTTQIATTAFVQDQKASPAFTGTPTAPTAATTTDTTQIATTAFVQQEITANAYSEPYASETQKGVARIYTSGGDLYIYTQD
jgi:hypothetical protein